MHQWHEHLLAVPPDLPHRLLHLGVTTTVTLLPYALQDPLGSVTLLLGESLVLLNDLPDPAQMRPQLRLGPRPLHPVPRRLRMLQDLLQRRPVHPRLPQDLPLAHPLIANPLPNLFPPLHVGIHPSPPGPDRLASTPSTPPSGDLQPG
jgi:hypothetical protein